MKTKELNFVETKIYGYFIHLTFKYWIFEVEGNMLKGFDISSLGKLQTILIHKDNVDEIVWLDLR